MEHPVNIYRVLDSDTTNPKESIQHTAPTGASEGYEGRKGEREGGNGEGGIRASHRNRDT